MQLRNNHARLLLGFITFVTLTLSTTAQSHPRLMWPTGVYPDRFAGSVTGFESIWSNPAGLGGIRGMEFVSMFDQRDPGFGDDLGYTLAVKGLGYSYRRLIDVSGDVDFREHIFAAGFSGNGSFSLGASYRYLTEAPGGLNKSHTWNIGALYRTDPRWSIGAVFNNLNKHKLDNQKSPVEITTGIGIRPLGTSQLTLSAEFSMSHEQSLKDAVFRYGAEGSPIHGLILYSLFDDESHYEIGARINFTNSFFGAQARMTDGDYQNSTFYVGASAVRQESIVASRKRTLAMSIKGDIEENPVQPFFGSQKPPFFSYVSAIHRAAVDPSVTALVLRIGQSNLSWAHMQELKNAIDHFTSEGKPALAYLDGPSNKNYYLAASATLIAVPPASYLGLTGLHAEMSYYAGTLDKLGVKVEAERIAEHKTAPEAYTQEGPSDESRAMLDRLLDEVYAQFVQGIASGRKMTVDQVKQAIDHGPYTSQDAHDAKLIDMLIYPDEIFKQSSKKRKEFSATPVGLSVFLEEVRASDRWTPSPALAIVVAEGSIGEETVDTPVTSGDVTSSLIGRGFAQAFSTPNLRGVAFRVNSPGGAATTSDLIYHQTQKAREYTPFVVSMAGVAASGGYYISAGAERIYAQPATLTGSIGIFALKPDISGLQEKIGMKTYSADRGRNAGIQSITSGFTDSQRERVRHGIRQFYNRFTSIVAEGRKISQDSVNSIGEGRVWTGSEATRIGLVDSTGGIWEAVNSLTNGEDIDEYEVHIYPERRTLIQLPSKSIFSPFTSLWKSIFGSGGPDEITRRLDSQSPFADYELKLPYEITIE